MIISINEFKEYLSNDTSFDLERLKTMKTFVDRISYCQSHLERISSGSSRIVYKIDDTKVLKLAKNTKGISQNETEIRYSEFGDISSIVTRSFESDDDYLWVEMEYAKKMTKNDFKAITGFVFDDYCKVIWSYSNMVLHNGGGDSDVDKDVVTQMWEDEFVFPILDFIGNYRFPAGDLTRLNSYGIVERDGAKTIVITDFGLTQDVYLAHYKK